MSENREKIAELYFRSQTVKVGGQFELSIHRDHPELPLSPWYMHYPNPDEPGARLLPIMFELIGAEFYAICESQKVAVRPRRIGGHPDGAIPLGKAWARQYVSFPKNHVEFGKLQLPDGQPTYSVTRGEYMSGDEFGPCEDHVSAARNNRIFLNYLRSKGLTVTHLLSVVDRQQGAAENLADQGVTLLSIFTADALLEYGLAERHITKPQFDEIQEYREANQYLLAG